MVTDTVDSVVRSALATHQLPLHYYLEFAHHALRCLRDLEMDIGLKSIRKETITLDSQGEYTVAADVIDVSPNPMFEFDRNTGIICSPENPDTEIEIWSLIRTSRVGDILDPYCVPTLESYIAYEFARHRGSARNQYQIEGARRELDREMKKLRARRTRDMVGFIRKLIAGGSNQYSVYAHNNKTLEDTTDDRNY